MNEYYSEKNINDAFTRSFEKYLNLCDESMDSFNNRLLDMNTTYIKRYLDPLFHYGLIDVLLPLNELVLYLMKDKEKEKWWRELINSMENSYIVSDFEEDFHSAIINSPFYKPAPEIPYYWLFREPLPGIKDLIWGMVKDKVLDNKYKDLIGFILSGLYSDHIKADILSLLDIIVLPRLLGELDKDTDFTNPLNPQEKMTLKYIVNVISQILGVYYYRQFTASGPRVLLAANSKEKGFYELDKNDLKRVLFENSLIEGYITPTYLNSINRLNSYVDFFMIDNFYNRTLKLVAPLLHQCIGENDKAYDLLLEIIRFGDTNDRYTIINLVSIIRAVSQTRFDKRSTIKNELILLWNNIEIPKSLIITLKSIVKFFKKLSYEIPKRFREKELHEILDNASYEDKGFYTFYYGTPRGDDNIEALSIVSPYLFENFDVVNRLEQFVRIIEDKKSKYSERLFTISLFYDLFASLASHNGRYTRIKTRNCFRNMWRDQYTEFGELELAISKHNFKDEIYHVYSDTDLQTLQLLKEQLKMCIKNLPSCVAAQEFELFIFDDDNEQIHFDMLNKNDEMILKTVTELKNKTEETNETAKEIIRITEGIDYKTDDFYGFLCNILDGLKSISSDDAEVMKKLDEFKESTKKSGKTKAQIALEVVGFLGSIASISSSPEGQLLLQKIVEYFSHYL